MKTGVQRDLPADVRQLIVRELGAALAAAWRKREAQKNERPDPRGETADRAEADSAVEAAGQ